MTNGSLSLVVRRTIRAPIDRVFSAWTEPEQLRAWWGPRPVTCADAEVDLRVGGRYRIVNRLPDGALITIEGEFHVVEPPRRLVYSWAIDDGDAAVSRVTVRFEARGDATEVVVVHDEIARARVRDSHEKGWEGCLDGLARAFDVAPA
jgi:uncharacterized protein YndB with AHSA1/START domain